MKHFQFVNKGRGVYEESKKEALVTIEIKWQESSSSKVQALFGLKSKVSSQKDDRPPPLFLAPFIPRLERLGFFD